MARKLGEGVGRIVKPRNLDNVRVEEKILAGRRAVEILSYAQDRVAHYSAQRGPWSEMERSLLLDAWGGVVQRLGLCAKNCLDKKP